MPAPRRRSRGRRHTAGCPLVPSRCGGAAPASSYSSSPARAPSASRREPSAVCVGLCSPCFHLPSSRTHGAAGVWRWSASGRGCLLFAAHTCPQPLAPCPPSSRPARAYGVGRYVRHVRHSPRGQQRSNQARTVRARAWKTHGRLAGISDAWARSETGSAPTKRRSRTFVRPSRHRIHEQSRAKEAPSTNKKHNTLPEAKKEQQHRADGQDRRAQPPHRHALPMRRVRHVRLVDGAARPPPPPRPRRRRGQL